MPRLCSPIHWYGGKGLLVSKLLPLLPDGKIYVEPYSGGASLFFAKEPHSVEVLNDINRDIYNLFAVFKDREAYNDFRYKVSMTPYAFVEYKDACRILKQGISNIPDVQRAWAFFVSVNQGFNGKNLLGSWSKAFVPRTGVSRNVNSWLKRLALLDVFRWRLMMAQIDCRDALEVIKYWDSSDTVFYIDPPYVQSTRRSPCAYAYECTDDHHAALVDTLLQIKGKAMVSGYENDLYQMLSKQWRVVRFETTCSAAGRTRVSGLQGDGNVKRKQKRVEVVWIKE